MIEDDYPGLILERADLNRDISGPHSSSGGGGGKGQIRVIRLRSAEKEQREVRLRREAWDKVLMECGFATIFQAISDACNGRKFTDTHTRAFLDGMSTDLSDGPNDEMVESARRIPIIVHNGLHDLMFLLTHCHHPTLPESFEGTKRIIQKYFPLVFDTKVIADEYSDSIVKAGSSNLGDLYGGTCVNSGIQNIHSQPSLPSRITNQDGKGQGQAHEAAWDAYMTGCVFNALCNRILETKKRLGTFMPLDRLLLAPPLARLY
jgi:poly(A)-specific ribonuclease